MPTLETPTSPFAAAWLNKFSSAFAERSVDAISALLFPTGWLRDELVLSWNTRALGGREAISSYLSTALSSNDGQHVPSDFKLAPELLWTMDGVPDFVELAFTFETPLVLGRGIARLAKDGDNGKWKAQYVFLSGKDLKGHEEKVAKVPARYFNEALVREQAEDIGQQPYVLVVGAGQTGLQVAARLKQCGIPTLVLERNARVGDQWRKRYSGLTLNTPRARNVLLYQSYPSTWPIYIPKDKMADWLEHYASFQDLQVWTNSHILPSPAPSYDSSTGRWTLNISQSGTSILHPAHIIFATSTLGHLVTPTIPGTNTTRIRTLHASTFVDAAPYVSKRVLIVGAGNTAADICIALHAGGAASVTMLQRTPTPVITPDVGAGYWASTHPEGADTELADFKMASRAWGMVRASARAAREQGEVPSFLSEADAKMVRQLEEKGYRVGEGEDGLGAAAPIMERFAGYLLENGVADLIIDGAISIKSGVTIAQFTESTVIFSDESELEVDTVIFATGYGDPREPLREVFGNEIIDQAGLFWGTDEEGELRGAYRPTGHPGIWYAGGDFVHSRWGSKQLTLHIKARMLGLTK